MTDRFGWRPARVRVGTVGKPHGLDGTVGIASPCGWYRFAKGATVLVAGEPRRIRRRAGEEHQTLVAFEGVDDRTAADALRGAPIEIERDALPEPEADSWFRFDLVGCEVLRGAERLGVITEVEDGVAHDVPVLDSGLRLPFVAAVVPEVDVLARRVGVAPDFAPG